MKLLYSEVFDDVDDDDDDDTMIFSESRIVVLAVLLSPLYSSNAGLVVVDVAEWSVLHESIHSGELIRTIGMMLMQLLMVMMIYPYSDGGCEVKDIITWSTCLTNQSVCISQLISETFLQYLRSRCISSSSRLQESLLQILIISFQELFHGGRGGYCVSEAFFTQRSTATRVWVNENVCWCPFIVNSETAFITFIRHFLWKYHSLIAVVGDDGVLRAGRWQWRHQVLTA